MLKFEKGVREAGLDNLPYGDLEILPVDVLTKVVHFLHGPSYDCKDEQGSQFNYTNINTYFMICFLFCLFYTALMCTNKHFWSHKDYYIVRALLNEHVLHANATTRGSRYGDRDKFNFHAGTNNLSLSFRSKYQFKLLTASARMFIAISKTIMRKNNIDIRNLTLN